MATVGGIANLTGFAIPIERAILHFPEPVLVFGLSGSMSVNITSPVFKADPFPFYARLRAETPVFTVKLPDKRTAWLITRYDDVVAVLKDERFAKDRFKALSPSQLAKQPWIPESFMPLVHNMLDRDGADHVRLRALVHKAFTPRVVEQMRLRIESLTNKLFDAVERRGKMDLIRDFALPLPTTIIAEVLGVDPRDRHKFHRWSSSMLVATSSKWGVLRALPQIMAFMRYIRKLIRSRCAVPRDDLITMLIQAEESGDKLSEDELLAMVFLLLFAGHETTVNLIGNATLALLGHPREFEKLRRDPALMKSAVEELLRFDGPLETATERFASEDLTVAGVAIPRGELVLAVLTSANRDERQFTEANTLDLARTDNQHVAFGFGVHYCVGAPLARLEGQIALSTLLRRTSNLRLAVPASRLRWRRGLVLRGLEALPVTFSK